MRNIFIYSSFHNEIIIRVIAQTPISAAKKFSKYLSQSKFVFTHFKSNQSYLCNQQGTFYIQPLKTSGLP